MSSSTSTNDLRNRIIFTIAILSVYRFGTFVPLPGIDPEQLKILMDLCKMFNFVRINAVLVAGIDLTKASHFKTNKRASKPTSEQASEQKG